MSDYTKTGKKVKSIYDGRFDLTYNGVYDVFIDNKGDEFIMDDGGIRGEIEYFIQQNNEPYPFGVASCIVALQVSVVLLTRLNHIG